MPQYHLRPLEEDGIGKLNLEVALPGARQNICHLAGSIVLCQSPDLTRLRSFAGVQSAAEIEVVVTDRSISVRVPGLYRLVRPCKLQPQSICFTTNMYSTDFIFPLPSLLIST